MKGNIRLDNLFWSRSNVGIDLIISENVYGEDKLITLTSNNSRRQHRLFKEEILTEKHG